MLQKSGPFLMYLNFSDNTIRQDAKPNKTKAYKARDKIAEHRTSFGKYQVGCP